MSSIIKHSFKEAAQRSLVFNWDLPVLREDRVFLWAEGFTSRSLANTGQDVRNIEAHRPGFAQICRRGIASARLIVGLGSLNDAAARGSLVLGKSATLPFVAQPSPDIFRIVQNLSSKVFTNAF
ncbi:hypothetical protein SAMN05660385_03681 [Pseudomonas sp. URIL14HWK12:I5]|nr:hypothetical protein SAMN05660385_03681 [Pseudomonas sp. URIL14HWK12:I5]